MHSLSEPGKMSLMTSSGSDVLNQSAARSINRISPINANRNPMYDRLTWFRSKGPHLPEIDYALIIETREIKAGR